MSKRRLRQFSPDPGALNQTETAACRWVNQAGLDGEIGPGTTSNGAEEMARLRKQSRAVIGKCEILGRAVGSCQMVADDPLARAQAAQTRWHNKGAVNPWSESADNPASATK